MVKHSNRLSNKHSNKHGAKGSTFDERQKSLLPGTKEYRAKEALARLKEAYGEDDPVEEVSLHPKPVVEKEKYDPSKDMAHDVAVRKFRRVRSKQRLAEDIKDDLDTALNKDVPIHNKLNVPGIRSMDDELYDDSVSEKDFRKDVVRDYERDIKSLMNTDNNKDGQIDEDDITPALRKINKYMR